MYSARVTTPLGLAVDESERNRALGDEYARKPVDEQGREAVQPGGGLRHGKTLSGSWFPVAAADD